MMKCRRILFHSKRRYIITSNTATFTVSPHNTLSLTHKLVELTFLFNALISIGILPRRKHWVGIIIHEHRTLRVILREHQLGVREILVSKSSCVSSHVRREIHISRPGSNTSGKWRWIAHRRNRTGTLLHIQIEIWHLLAQLHSRNSTYLQVPILELKWDLCMGWHRNGTGTLDVHASSSRSNNGTAGPDYATTYGSTWLARHSTSGWGRLRNHTGQWVGQTHLSQILWCIIKERDGGKERGRGGRKTRTWNDKVTSLRLNWFTSAADVCLA